MVECRTCGNFNCAGYSGGKLNCANYIPQKPKTNADRSRSMSDEELAKLAGVEVLVVNALRFEPHDSHFSVAEAMQLIEKVAPRKAYLTHMSHDIGLHCVANLRLNEGVEFAYDGLVIEV